MHRDCGVADEWKAALNSAGGIAEGSEKIIRLLGRAGAEMGVTRQFDVDYPRITNFFQGLDYRGKIDFSLPKHQVLVDPTTHILNVNIF